MTDKQIIIQLQRELREIKDKASLALWCCQTDVLHSDKIGKTKDAILDEFYTVHDIPVDVQEHLEERFNCHLCVPESSMSSDLFDDLPLPDGKHPCVIDVPARAGGGLNTAAKAHTMKADVQVLNGQVNIIDIFKLTGAHTEVDPDHRFIESVCMLDKKTITIHYGS